MKKIAALLCSLLILFSAGAALAQGASYIPCDCGQNPCTCFIQVGDEGGFVKGIVLLLKEQGYCGDKVKITIFTEEARAGVMKFQEENALPVIGTLDDDTLTLLIWGMLPEELDARKPFDPDDPLTNPETVFVPTDGGKDRHRRATCSGILDPRKVSVRNAEKMGFPPCSQCKPN